MYVQFLFSFFCSDEGVSFAAEQGIRASRSHVKYFKHNDTDDLERLLLEQAAVDRQVGSVFIFYRHDNIVYVLDILTFVIWSFLLLQ